MSYRIIFRNGSEQNKEILGNFVEAKSNSEPIELTKEQLPEVLVDRSIMIYRILQHDYSNETPEPQKPVESETPRKPKKKVQDTTEEG